MCRCRSFPASLWSSSRWSESTAGPSQPGSGGVVVATTTGMENALRSAVPARLAMLVLLAVAASGCEMVGDIFEAGIWVGVILVAVVVAAIAFVVAKLRRS
jgi:hypothetical protein